MLPRPLLMKNVSAPKGKYSSVSFPDSDQSLPSFTERVSTSSRGPRQVLANIVFVGACIDGNGFSQIYWDSAPLPGNEQPGTSWLNVGFRHPHFTDDIRIRELSDERTPDARCRKAVIGACYLWRTARRR